MIPQYSVITPFGLKGTFHERESDIESLETPERF